MDSVFWKAKRTHHAALGFCRPLLKEFRLTPARYDLLFWLAEQQEEATQSALRHALGVARATISEMLAAIEKLGFVTRSRCEKDRRTFLVTLTALGRALLNGAHAKWVFPTGLVPLSIDAVMARFDVECDPYGERFVYGEACSRLRSFLGDRALRDLYDDDVEDLGLITLPGHGSDGVPFVDEIVSVL